jgi:hypothetical protein
MKPTTPQPPQPPGMQPYRTDYGTPQIYRTGGGTPSQANGMIAVDRAMPTLFGGAQAQPQSSNLFDLVRATGMFR